MDTGYGTSQTPRQHRFSGKVALVTGGSSGIGLATVEAFAVEGAEVISCSLDQTRGEATAAEVAMRTGQTVHFIRADVSDGDDVEALARQVEQRCGRLDVVVSNAGIVADGTALETSEELWQLIVNTNLGGHFRIAKHTIPLIQRSGGGAITLVSSEHGLVATARRVAYCAAKGGTFNLTRALAIDCAELGIRVNCLAPGAVDTPMAAGSFSDTGDAAAAEAAQVAPIPLKRMGRSSEIASAALFLSSDESSYMTGSTLLVDGGVTTGYGA